MSVIVIDLGATKIAAAIVSSRGSVRCQSQESTYLREEWPGLKKQIIRICESQLLIDRSISGIGIASAGPLHAPSGTLLDPTNFGWKRHVKVLLKKELERALHLPVMLENDAAASALAESWKGIAGKNAIIITLGTGLGVGILINGKLLRGARGLHPEIGHLILDISDKTALCGCGAYGCAEAYLSGMNFTKRANRILNKNLSTLELLKLSKKIQQELFTEYSQRLAQFLHSLIVLYYPEKIIFAGSFSQAADCFLPDTERHLKKLLLRRSQTISLIPKLKVSTLQERSGTLGAAYIALHRKYWLQD